jgi:hypothetical protein
MGGITYIRRWSIVHHVKLEVYPPRRFEKVLYLHHIDGVLSTIWRDGVVGVSIHGQLEDDFTPLSINPATLAHVWAAA